MPVEQAASAYMVADDSVVSCRRWLRDRDAAGERYPAAAAVRDAASADPETAAYPVSDNRGAVIPFEAAVFDAAVFGI